MEELSIPLKVLLGINTATGLLAAAVYATKGEKLVLKNYPGEAYTPLTAKVAQGQACAVAGLAVLSGAALATGDASVGTLGAITTYHGGLAAVYGANKASSFGTHAVQFAGFAFFLAKAVFKF